MQSHDVERNAPNSIIPSKAVGYGTVEIADSASGNGSFVDELSPIDDRVRPGYQLPHQHRIIPPSITGHGRLILAHRIVPYWIGALFVVGAFAWAVWCAIFVYPLLGGHPNNWRSIGEGWAKGWLLADNAP